MRKKTKNYKLSNIYVPVFGLEHEICLDVQFDCTFCCKKTDIKNGTPPQIFGDSYHKMCAEAELLSKYIRIYFDNNAGNIVIEIEENPYYKTAQVIGQREGIGNSLTEFESLSTAKLIGKLSKHCRKIHEDRLMFEELQVFDIEFLD